MATQSSPGLGEAGAAEARCWDREQTYLAGLVERYHPEQYPDSYEAMSEWAGHGDGSLAGMSLWGDCGCTVLSLQRSLLSPASYTTGSPGPPPSPRTPGATRTQTTPLCS